MADLGRWLTGAYHVPGQSTSGTDETDSPALDDIDEDDTGVPR